MTGDDAEARDVLPRRPRRAEGGSSMFTPAGTTWGDDETRPISDTPFAGRRALRSPGGAVGAHRAAGEAAPAPGMITHGDEYTDTVNAVFDDPRFRELRSRVRRFAFVGTAVFLGWYGVFVVLAAFFPDVMGTPVFDSINVGMLLGIAQFVSTLLIVWAYNRFSTAEVDPRVEELREAHAARPAEPAPVHDDMWSV
ncbi:DUF485 domain-containing protein [Pseudonocardia phyllosphaerae]|uniref:DUF485 domain-containing protein n=1 Tax=Pseudonocardia phyllosphaerae TaxID=3390502 RepID=UPI00397A590F